MEKTVDFLAQNKLLYTPKEAAIILWGIHDHTTRKRIYKMMQDNIINCIKDGSRYWIPKKELLRFGDLETEESKIQIGNN
tara:strand:+ start:354 stop:593 length:240 start_codon:yes stop_codon:yes gene_type:complete